MKKICITALLLGASFGLFAQTMSPTNPIKYSMPNTYLEKPYTYSPQKMNNTLSSTSRWYNYGATVNNTALAGQARVKWGILFPDTTILVKYSNGYFGTDIHAIADVLDVSSSWFNDATLSDFSTGQLYNEGQLSLGKKSFFKLDSITFFFRYNRNMNDATIVDTLQFDIAVNNVDYATWNLNDSTYDFFTDYFRNQKQKFGVDTMYFKDFAYNRTTNSLNLPNKISFKRPLTDTTYKDSTANGGHYVSFATTGLATVTAGKYVVTAVKFIPGYAWVANQDTISKKNSVIFSSLKEIDNQYAKANTTYLEKDYNISYIANSQTKYDTAKTAWWKGRYLPSIAFNNGYFYEHHDIWYKVSGVSNYGVVSTNDLVSSKNAVILDDAYPNPFNKSTVVSYELPKQARVSLEIYDITGRKLMTYNEGSQSSGKHSISVDASKLAKGIYFYTLRADEVSITKRMVIAE